MVMIESVMESVFSKAQVIPVEALLKMAVMESVLESVFGKASGLC